jgi:hypothetical protein
MGLSRRVTVHCGTSFSNERHARRAGSPKPRKVKLNKTRRELREAQRKHHERMASMYMSSPPVLYTNLLKYVALSFQERQDLLDGAQNDINMELDGDDAWEDVNHEDVVLSVPPPGEEGFFLSHAGGETVLQQIFVDSLSKWYAIFPSFEVNLTDIRQGNGTIFEHDRIVSSVGCSNGKCNSRISSMLISHSRLMVRAYRTPKILDDGTSRSLISKVSTRTEVLGLSTYLVHQHEVFHLVSYATVSLWESSHECTRLRTPLTWLTNLVTPTTAILR